MRYTTKMWQDVLLGVVNWLLVAFLLPTVVSKTEKPAFVSSLLTGICLFGIAISYYTLGLTVGALPATLQALLWFILAYQRWRLNRAEGKHPIHFWK